MRNKKQMQTKELQKTTWKTRFRRLAIAGGLVALTAVPMGFSGNGGISRVSAAAGDVKIDEAHFPDEGFRSYISENIDKNKDGVLSKAEIKKVTEIILGSYDCATLTGIGTFTELKKLDCSGTDLKKIDVSHNPKLKELNCSGTGLKKLDVSKNPKLETLYCGAYRTNYYWLEKNRLKINRLTKLDVSKNPKLEYLDCSGNLLTKLDTSRNPKLTTLDCVGNRLVKLDVSKNLKLEKLDCSLLYIRDGSTEKVWASNRLTKLDVSRNTALTYLNCSGNRLTTLDVSKNPKLQYLYCHENKLTSLDVRKNAQLVELGCRSNKLKKLDLTNNVRLMWLNCYNNKLTKLDTSHNSGLHTVYCGNNKLTKLDVSENPFIQELYYDNNKLKKVIVPEKTLENAEGEDPDIGNIGEYNKDKVTIVKKKINLKNARYIVRWNRSRYYVTGEEKDYKTVKAELVQGRFGYESEKGWFSDFVLENQKYVVTEIGANVCYGHGFVYKESIPPIGASVRKIGSKAFARTTGLENITIGRELESLGSYVFANSKDLKTITIKSTKLTSKTVDKKAFAGIKASTTIKVPKSKLTAYKKLFRKCGLGKKVKIKAI